MSIIDEKSKLAYSIKEAAEATSISRSKLYELIASGKIEVRKVGKRTLISAAVLRGFLDG